MSALDFALILASVGCRIFPLKPGTKVPATPHGQDDATDDTTQVRAWFTKNPRFNYGVHCAPSGLYVVDIDSGPGKDGQASWDALVAANGHVPTYTVRTQGGGTHLYYRMPAEPLSNTASRLGKHIDTRGNGYVVGPGSVINGREYTVLDNRQPADLPQWIVDAVRKPPPPPAPTLDGLLVVAPAEDVRGRVEQFAEELAYAPEGTRNTVAARLAFMAGQFVGAGQISAAEAVDILEAAVSGDPEHVRGMRTTIRNQVEAGARVPRVWQAARFPARAATQHQDVAVPDPTDKRVLSDWGSDGGQGRWLASMLGGIEWTKGLGWLMWDGQRWRAVSDEAVSSVVRRLYAREFTRWATQYAQDGTDKAEAMAKVFRALQNTSNLRGVLAGLRDAVIVDDSEYDKHVGILNTQSGIVNLTDGSMLPHDHPDAPTYRCTKVTDGAFVPGYRHPDWDAAHAALPVETLDWLQARMGAALVGRQMCDDAVFLHGGGSNGKSLFSNDGIVRALGDYGMLINSEVLGGRIARDGQASPDKAEFRGARFVLIEELPEEFSLSTKALKELAGTGQITARKLYRDPVVFDATHSLFINTNHVPNVSDTDWGTWRRLSLVPFPYTFVTRPTEPEHLKGDRDLVRRIRANESGQWDAIVTWLIEGAMAVLADDTPVTIGKTVDDDGRCSAVREATRKWRGDTDKLMAYADEWLEPDPNGCIAKSDFLWHFNRWLAAQGNTKWSARLIGTRMDGHPSFNRVRVARHNAAVTMHRPPMPEEWNESLPTLSARPEVFTNIRFKSNTCQCPNRVHGQHHDACLMAS